MSITPKSRYSKYLKNIVFQFLGYLAGGEDYFTHIQCRTFKGHEGCGVDLHFTDPYSVDRSEKGNYSAHLFTRKAVEIIQNADQKKVSYNYMHRCSLPDTSMLASVVAGLIEKASHSRLVMFFY